MTDPLDNDPELADLRRAAAAKRRNTLLAVAAVILAPLLYWLSGFSAVRSDLEQEGFTEIEISAAGAFEYSFDAKKGNAECKGTVTRLPFASSRNVGCFSVGKP